MLRRKQLHLAWENHDDADFLSACELAEAISAAAGDREARFELNVQRSPARAELWLGLVLAQREELLRLWQSIKAWPGSHANEDMDAWQDCMEEVAACHAHHAARPLAACGISKKQNLRFAGCKRVRPALGPLDIERPFDVRVTYWAMGRQRPGGWDFDKRAIWNGWMVGTKMLGYQYCPRFGGLYAAFALLPESAACGPEEAWRLAEAPLPLQDYGEDIAPPRIAVPRDVPIPKGYRRIKV